MGRVSYLSVLLSMSCVFAMSGILVFWICEWIFTPLKWSDWMKHICEFGYLDLEGAAKWTDWSNHISESGYLDLEDATWLISAFPILILTILSYLYLKIDRNKFPNRSLPFGKFVPRWARTLIFSNRVFGIVTLSEIFWLTIAIFIIVWLFSRETWATMKSIDIRWAELIKNKKETPTKSIWQWKMDEILHKFGMVAGSILSIMFFPVARRSPLLRAIGVPFEKAVNYHQWISHIMLTCMTIHAMGYLIFRILRGEFTNVPWEWKKHQISHLAGVMTFVTGISIWITAISPIRRKFFEIFIRTHQLYFIFVLCFLMHLKSYWFVILFPSLLIYGIDRILRMVQGMHLVQAEGTVLHSDGTIELTLPTATDFKYKTLDSLFINVPILSQLQWHPFSIASSPLDGNNKISLLVKPAGEWTHGLRKLVANQEPILLRVEGPYGQEQDYFSKYDSLVLIAGGSGISAIMSLLRDLLHRCRSKQQRLPSGVTFVWTVKSPSSFALLEEIEAAVICPDYDQSVNLRVEIFITDNLEGMAEKDAANASQLLLESTRQIWKNNHPVEPQIGAGRDLLSLAIYCFVGATTFATIVGFLKWLLLPLSPTHDRVTPWWVGDMLYFAAFLVGLFASMGIVIALWYIARTGTTSNSILDEVDTELVKKNTSMMGKGNKFSFLSDPKITYGSRPNFNDILTRVVEHAMVKDIGVLICGPRGMEVDVANECRTLSPGPFSLPFSGKRPVLNFHSLGFTL